MCVLLWLFLGGFLIYFVVVVVLFLFVVVFGGWGFVLAFLNKFSLHIHGRNYIEANASYRN